MIEYYFTFRSITTAQRGARACDMEGVPYHLVRTPKDMAKQGCGYSLRVPLAYGRAAAILLQREKILYQRIYQSSVGTAGTEVVL